MSSQYSTPVGGFSLVDTTVFDNIKVTNTQSADEDKIRATNVSATQEYTVIMIQSIPDNSNDSRVTLLSMIIVIINFFFSVIL